MSGETDQKLKAYLLNETTGASVSLNICASDCSYLTKEKGLLLNYDDYTYYKYNYDGAGFRIDIDFGELAKNPEFSDDNVIIVSYENIISSGETVLKGAVKEVKDKLKEYCSVHDQYKGTLETDPQNIIKVRWTSLGREGLPVKRPPRPNPKDTLIIQQLKEEQTRYKELDRILKEEQKRRKELDLALKEEQKRRKELDGRILRLKQSVSYKLGRVLTFIPRKIKEML